MTPDEFLVQIISPGLHNLYDLGGPYVTDDAARFLLVVALQESGPMLVARYQGYPGEAGPARGWWQFEEGGAVKGVMTHQATKSVAGEVCSDCSVNHDTSAVWRALEGHDVLAVSFARMLVMTDPNPIPTEEQPAWDYYINLWRPGKPHPDTWPTNWKVASDTIMRVK
jgi:hypothetical protein